MYIYVSISIYEYKAMNAYFNLWLIIDYCHYLFCSLKFPRLGHWKSLYVDF